MDNPVGVKKRDELIGDGMVRTGLLSREQVDMVLMKQNDGDMRLFGQIALELGYIDGPGLVAFLSSPDQKDDVSGGRGRI